MVRLLSMMNHSLRTCPTNSISIRNEGNLYQILAIDAYPCHGTYKFSEEGILREINKSYAGFRLCRDDQVGLASGKWGCGVFGGNPFLKSIEQWISASLAKKPVDGYEFCNAVACNDHI